MFTLVFFILFIYSIIEESSESETLNHLAIIITTAEVHSNCDKDFRSKNNLTLLSITNGSKEKTLNNNYNEINTNNEENTSTISDEIIKTSNLDSLVLNFKEEKEVLINNQELKKVNFKTNYFVLETIIIVILISLMILGLFTCLYLYRY